MACSSLRESAFCRTHALTSSGSPLSDEEGVALEDGVADPAVDDSDLPVGEALSDGVEPLPQAAVSAPTRARAAAAVSRRRGRAVEREVTPRR
ncbi:hypothetical protein N798_09550 [Knoellia flava TL1]|uniref:Uncharacterized protein n=2 Tax=Knoellia flava TaxID=913969 RepID=A0A8H9KUN2_9MICO|nr:hypothetical protein N798_09550 [Knoellia flava TL1]GGB82914.1 hypothetical protein GCM10011314_23170 [Knoellia flava]